MSSLLFFTAYYTHTNITVTKQEHITEETKTHDKEKQVTRQEQNTKGTKMTGKANKIKYSYSTTGDNSQSYILIYYYYYYYFS